MATTKDTFDWFIRKFDEIVENSPNVLSDKERFKELSQNMEFRRENNVMYLAAAFFRYPAPNLTNEKLSAEDLKDDFTDDLPDFLKAFSNFVIKWKTKPISSWLFFDASEGMKERMERAFYLTSKYHVIEVYPWTTKEEVNRKFDEIRKTRISFRLRPEQYALNFKAWALRDAEWRWTEIMGFLSSGNENDKEFAAKINEREKELRGQGKTASEIDELLDKEFSYEEFDKALENVPEYDALRKRKKATDDLIEKVLQIFEVGK